jgi:DNA-binding NtrC family response regulator
MWTMVERRILAFSRDPDFTELYTAAFEAENLPPVATDDVDELADLLPAHPVAVALVDLLGEPDWHPVAAILERGIPTIVVTGWWSPDRVFRERAFAAGAAAYVVTPVSPADLLAVVRRVLDGERRIDVLPPSR